MWTCQRAGDGSSQVWLADFVLPLDRDAETAAEAAADASEPAGARPERLQVEDPDTGLFFLYDMATHRLTVYDPRTHQERAAEGAEIQRAMELFNAAGGDGD
jgi:hypothetical protein